MHLKTDGKDNLPHKMPSLEYQVEAMLTLKDLDGKPFPVFPDTNSTLVLVPFSEHVKSAQWVSVDPTVLLNSLN